jgi:hypothetical protein
MRTPRISSCLLASWRRPRIALIGILALASGVIFGASAQPAVASSPGQLASRLTVVAKSPAAKATQRQLDSAIADPSVARASESLIAQYGSHLTTFQTDLLQVNILIGQPRNRAVLAALTEGHRLTSAQIRLLGHLLLAIAHNPAIALLDEKGRVLEKHPEQLTADIAALKPEPTQLASLTPATENPAFTAAAPGLGPALTSPSARSFSEQMQQILSSSETTKYIQKLPPLFVASFIPSQQVASYVLPSAYGKANRNVSASKRDARDAKIAIPSLSPQANDALNVAMDFARMTAPILATAALGYTVVSLLPVSASLAILIGANVVRPAVVAFLGPEAIVVIAGAWAGYQLAGDIEDFLKLGADAGTLIGDTLAPGSTPTGPVSANASQVVHLALSPPNTKVTLGGSQAYTVEGLDASNNPLGAVAIGPFPNQATLSIRPDGTCIDAICTPEKTGEHIITAIDGNAEGTTSLTVTEPESKSTGPTIEPSTLPEATLGEPYEHSLTLAGADEVETWRVSSGTLPRGIELKVYDRPEQQPVPELYGLPSDPGSNTFTISAYSNNNELVASQTYTVNVKAPGFIYINATNNYDEGPYRCDDCKTMVYDDSGEPFELELDTELGAPPYTWTIDGSNAPYDGVKIEPRSGYQLPWVLNGDPLEGVIVVPIEVRDDYGDVGKMELTIETPE